MKLQFSLATLLVCMTVLAVVAGTAAAIPVHATILIGGGVEPDSWLDRSEIIRPPYVVEVLIRSAIWGPVAITATLGVIWAIRRLKSRRHTEPPVG